MRTIATSAGLAIGLALYGCGGDPIAFVDPDDLPELDHVVVEGQLVAVGEPVDRANIRIAVHSLGCEGDPLGGRLDIHPDSQGRFREAIGVPATTPAFRGCLEIIVVPIGFAQLRTTTVRIDEVQFVPLADDPFTVEIQIEVELRIA